MHLARPKSSKGRSRPPVSSSLFPDDMDYSTQGPPASPDPPAHPSRPDRNLRSQSQPMMWQTDQLSQGEVSQMLQHAPAAPPQSLNKYKVLPSIQRRQSDPRSLDRRLSELQLCDDATLLEGIQGSNPPALKTCNPEREIQGTLWPKQPPDPGSGAKEGCLHLAIRAPCGRRFQHHFDPTDTLLRVKSTAELQYGVQYGEVSVETMDVPRRTFTDMRLTLAQCGIVNRSVLFIAQVEKV
ncbi:UBX domain-containing protein 10 [Halichoeres trimaculatus]|uniref:UBX domain-containing protein 10 n=1 Tax=Halichoeres trimaculatus TaxID=147232 RepID=UPI003D9DE484